MVIGYLIYVGVIRGHYICDGNSLGLTVIAEHAINTDGVPNLPCYVAAYWDHGVGM